MAIKDLNKPCRVIHPSGSITSPMSYKGAQEYCNDHVGSRVISADLNVQGYVPPKRFELLGSSRGLFRIYDSKKNLTVLDQHYHNTQYFSVDYLQSLTDILNAGVDK